MPSKFTQMAETDEEAVRSAAPFPVQKAEVLEAPSHPSEDGFHQVYVRLYYDDSQQRAIVLTGKIGDVSVPEEGDDVMVLFGAADKPVVIGAWYPTDDEYGNPNTDAVPQYEPGDRIIGSDGGSYIAIRKQGGVEIETDQFAAVDVDFQSAIAYQDTSQSIPGDDQWYQIEYNVTEEDPAELYDEDAYAYTLRHDGSYDVDANLMFPNPGQNNRYQIAIYVNGTLEKRKARQSATNNDLSLNVSLDKSLNEGDVIEVYVKQDSGSTRDTFGSSTTNDFVIKRNGL